MEMTTAYLRETVAHIAKHGWAHEVTHDEAARDGVMVYRSEVHELRRPDGAHLRLEAIAYADGRHRWYLEFTEFGGLACTSYRLDSWRHREDRVELKFYADPDTGEGLSLVLMLD